MCSRFRRCAPSQPPSRPAASRLAAPRAMVSGLTFIRAELLTVARLERVGDSNVAVGRAGSANLYGKVREAAHALQACVIGLGRLRMLRGDYRDGGIVSRAEAPEVQVDDPLPLRL